MDFSRCLVKGIFLGLLFSGIIYGFQQYFVYQLYKVPFYLWFFVPDCPLSALIFLFAFSLSFKNSFLNHYSFFAMFKYGTIGTILSLLLIPEYSSMFYILFAAHLAMVFASFLAVREFNLNFVLISLSLLLLNDFFDSFFTISYLFSWTYLSFSQSIFLLFFFSFISPLVYFIATKCKEQVM